jgi:transcriptional regulator with XRE-family HTH domain
MINHEKIAELIHEKGIEQKALAEEVGVSEAMMSFIVRGLKEPSLTVLTRIAKALDVPVAELIIEE